jgi:hypothetical protein
VGAQYAKLDADKRASYRVAYTCLQFIPLMHDYYPFVVGDRGRLASLAVELVDRLATLVADCHFLGSCASKALGICTGFHARMTEFIVCRSTSEPFRHFPGDVCMYTWNLCNIFLLFLMEHLVPIFMTLCMVDELVLFHVFQLIGLILLE